MCTSEARFIDDYFVYYPWNTDTAGKFYLTGDIMLSGRSLRQLSPFDYWYLDQVLVAPLYLPQGSKLMDFVKKKTS